MTTTDTSWQIGAPYRAGLFQFITYHSWSGGGLKAEARYTVETRRLTPRSRLRGAVIAHRGLLAGKEAVADAIASGVIPPADDVDGVRAVHLEAIALAGRAPLPPPNLPPEGDVLQMLVEVVVDIKARLEAMEGDK